MDLRHRWSREGVELLSDDDDDLIRFSPHANELVNALERADSEASDPHLAEMKAIAARTPNVTSRWADLMHSAWLAGLAGDLGEYERRSESALNYGVEHNEAGAFTVYGMQLANIRFHQGRIHEQIPMMQQVLEESPAIYAYRAALILGKARNGELDEARSMLEDDRQGGFPMPEDSAWSTGMTCWADAASVLKATSAAEDLRRRLVPYHAQVVIGSVVFQASIAHYLGLLDHTLGRYDDAEAWFAESLDLHHRVRSPVLVASTRAAWATMLVDRNRGDDHHRARELAAAALAAAETGGYGYVERDARAVLERLA